MSISPAYRQTGSRECAEIRDTKKKREIVVTDPDEGISKTYLIPYGSRIKILDGAVLEAGDELTEGSVNPHDMSKIV